MWQGCSSEHVRAGARADVSRDCAFRGGFGTVLGCWENGMGAQKSPHEPFFGIVRFVVVSEAFSARFCVLFK